MSLEKNLAKALIRKKQTLSLAESCTGGLLSDRLTNIPGSSKFLMGSVICYSNRSKQKLLNVSSAAIKKHGAVSAVVARQMSAGARRLFRTDYSVSITGIAGPGGGTAQKPVGLTYIALSTLKQTRVKEFHFRGPRRKIKHQAATAALSLLLATFT